jgi:hypothetical protein
MSRVQASAYFTARSNSASVAQICSRSWAGVVLWMMLLTFQTNGCRPSSDCSWTRVSWSSVRHSEDHITLRLHETRNDQRPSTRWLALAGDHPCALSTIDRRHPWRGNPPGPSIKWLSDGGSKIFLGPIALQAATSGHQGHVQGH